LIENSEFLIRCNEIISKKVLKLLIPSHYKDVPYILLQKLILLVNQNF